MSALILSWGISVDIQVSRCLLYICFFWWWFVCSEYHFVLPCLTYKLVHEYLLVCSCHSIHFLACIPLLLIYLSFCWPQRLSSSEFFCLQWLLRYDPLLPLPLLSSLAGFTGLLVGYLQLLPLCIGVSRAFQRLVFSICQYLELILQLKYEGSLYFKVLQLLHVRVLPRAPTGYGIPQLQLQCGVVVTSCSSSSSHSGV